WFSPRVLEWVAPAALVLVFVLLFFSWVGIYPGGVPALTQTAWQAAFGSYSADPDVEHLTPIKEEPDKPGASVLMIFYVLLFLPVLVLTVGCLALNFVKVKLPPAVEQLLPWRRGIVAAANLFLFIFLGLQLALGFSLESRTRELIDKRVAEMKAKTTP